MKRVSTQNKQEVVISTDGTRGFFERGKAIAKLADEKKTIPNRRIINFESPEEMLTVLTKARRQLMQMIRKGPVSITELSHQIRRDRAAVAKDIKLLEHYGLIRVSDEINPGHGLHKIIYAVSKQPIHLETFI